jgi:hypothetical protein
MVDPEGGLFRLARVHHGASGACDGLPYSTLFHLIVGGGTRGLTIAELLTHPALLTTVTGRCS